MSAIGWETIENAIAAWVRNGSGFPTGKVIWDYQGGKRPDVPYIEMSLEDVGSVGHDWRTRTYDAGTDELVFTHSGHRTSNLVLQCFGIPGSGSSARPVLADVVSAIPVYQDALDVAEVGIGNVGPVQAVQGQRGSILEPRARVEIGLHLISNLEQRTDYIKRVTVTVTAKNVAGVDLITTAIIPPPAGFSSGFSPGFERGV